MSSRIPYIFRFDVSFSVNNGLEKKNEENLNN